MAYQMTLPKEFAVAPDRTRKYDCGCAESKAEIVAESHIDFEGRVRIETRRRRWMKNVCYMHSVDI